MDVIVQPSAVLPTSAKKTDRDLFSKRSVNLKVRVCKCEMLVLLYTTDFLKVDSQITQRQDIGARIRNGDRMP